MILAQQWVQNHQHDIHVATVNHGLRADSLQEAQTVAIWAQKLGFKHHLLNWHGAKPISRIQERAREARYQLILSCAQDIGATAIVTAHHLDDQAETILFRLIRGSGISGLAGMAPITKLKDVQLLRPLLCVTKDQLISVCDHVQHPYFVDPSNGDEKYARSRLRKLLPLLNAQGLDANALTRLGARAQRADAALDAYMTQAHEITCLETLPEMTRYCATALSKMPLEIVLRLVARDIKRLSPDTSIRLDRLERASTLLMNALDSHIAWQTTLAGILIKANKGVVELRLAPPRKSVTID
jgi:tRNA(Ile)-lysidine synthase